MADEQTRQKPLGDLVEGSSLPEWAQGLTERKLRFVMEYIVDRNGRKAAIRAGLTQTDSGGQTVSSVLLRDPDVRKALDALWAAELQQKLRLRDRIMEEVSTIAFADIGDAVQVNANTVSVNDFDAITDDVRRSIKRVKHTKGEKQESLELEMHDKLKALDLLDQMNGIPRATKKAPDKVQVDIKDSTFVVTEREARALGPG